MDEMPMTDAAPADTGDTKPIAAAEDDQTAPEMAAVAPTDTDDAASPQPEPISDPQPAASDASETEPAAVETPTPAQPATPATETAAAGADVAAEAEEMVDDAQAEAMVLVAGSVIIRRGDTLWQISRRVYGRGVKYTTIYLANQDQISDPGRIWPGQVFDVPRDADEDAEQMHRTLRDQRR